MPEYSLRDVPSPSRCNLHCSCYNKAAKAKQGQRILQLEVNSLFRLSKYSLCFDCFVRDTEKPSSLNWSNGQCHMCQKVLEENDADIYRVSYCNRIKLWAACWFCDDCRNQLLVPPPMTPEEAVKLINSPSQYLKGLSAKILGG